jgi:hypothetical protein
MEDWIRNFTTGRQPRLTAAPKIILLHRSCAQFMAATLLKELKASHHDRLFVQPSTYPCVSATGTNGQQFNGSMWATYCSSLSAGQLA